MLVHPWPRALGRGAASRLPRRPACESRAHDGRFEHAKAGLPTSRPTVSMLGCQLWRAGSLANGTGAGRREEPPRDESGFRAHGSNQRFHRLLRQAVARAPTTAPSLAGVSPAAPKILDPSEVAAQAPPAQGGLVVKRGRMLAPAPMPDSSVAARRSRALPWPARADRRVGRRLQRRRASASFTATGCPSDTTTDTHPKAEAQTQAAAKTQEAVTRTRQPHLGRRTGCAAAPPSVARAMRRSSTPDWAGRPGSRGRTGWR